MNKNNKILNYQLLYRRACLLVYDVVSVLAASFFAIAIRYEFELETIQEFFLETILRFLPFNIVLTILIFYFFKLYNSLWAFAGETELQNVIVASFLSSAVNGIGLIWLRWKRKRCRTVIILCMLSHWWP